MNVTIRAGSQMHSTINPFIYGNFMEFIERHISGMRAEMLENRHFADRMPDKSVAEFWKASGNNNTAEYAFDTGACGEAKSQRLLCTHDLGGFTGLSQGEIAVKKGKRYNGYVYLKQEWLQNPVEIAIGRDYGVYFIPYAKVEISCVGGSWKKYSFSLLSDSTDDHAVFTIRFRGTGTLWIDHPSLMPDDNIYGWRKDVVEYVRKLKPNIIRFPGGCYADTYHWRNAIGDRDFRIPQDNYFWSHVPLDFLESNKRTARHRRPIEPNDAGIDEFMLLCKETGTEALICVNVGSGTPQEAADFVEYCNGGPDTILGQLRARNGHAEPYNIKYWEIGNEMYGSHEVGYSGLDGYIERYKCFYAAMKAVDPTIRVIINGFDRPWNQSVLKEAGNITDYVDIHCYPDWTVDLEKTSTEDVFNNIFTRVKAVENQISELRDDIAAAGLSGRVKVAVCEYNITGGGWGPPRAFMATQAAALFNASLIHTFIRNCDLVEICNFSNLTNAWWSSCIRTNNASSHVTTCFNVLSMLSNLTGGRLLDSAVGFDVMDTVSAAESGSQFRTIPELDAVATYDETEHAVVLSVINKTSRNDIKAKISLDGFIPDGRVEVTSVSSQTMESMNDFASPDRVTPVKEILSVEDLGHFLFKPCSLTIIRIYVQK